MLPAGTGPAPASARPSVAFGEGRRPEATTTHVKVAEFQGPLALLLTLIEARQLDVLTVPLGGLADAYLDALATLDDDRLGNVSSFIAIASQLILIKSRAMLPRQVELPPGVLPEDEPDPEAELRARLILYRIHRDAGVRLQGEAALRAHRKAQLEERLQWGPAYEDGDLLFARENGTPMDPDGLSGTFKRRAAKLGLPRIRFHDMRHTHATLGLEAGIPPKVMQERLGHSSITMTLDLYSHVVPGMQKDAASRIAALIDAAG